MNSDNITALQNLAIKYKNEPDESVLNEIISILSRSLYLFLRKNNIPEMDAEDILSEFLAFHLETTIDKYDPDRDRTFFSYSLTRANFMIMNYYKKIKRRMKNEIASLTNPNTGTDMINDIADEKSGFNDLIREEIRSIFLEIIDELPSHLYRQTIYMRLIFPFKLSIDEYCMLLDLTPASFKTNLSRGLKYIREKILPDKMGKYGFTLNDILAGLSEDGELFYPSREAISGISDEKARELINEIYQSKGMMAADMLKNEDSRQLIRKGILELLKNEQLILRKDIVMDFIDEDRIFDFIENLEETSNYSTETTRHASSTGDEEMDSLIRILFSIRKENSLVTDPTPKFWQDILLPIETEPEDIEKELGIDFLDMSEVLSGRDNNSNLWKTVVNFIIDKYKAKFGKIPAALRYMLESNDEKLISMEYKMREKNIIEKARLLKQNKESGNR